MTPREREDAYYVSPGGSIRAVLQGDVLTMTIDRYPVRNAMDADGWAGLDAVLGRAESDDDVRCLVLMGAGGTFCSGADMSAPSPGHPLPRIRSIGRVAQRLFAFPKPVIARVEGYAIGAGWSLALCCDVVVAAEDAKFSAIFAARGLSLDFGASWLLPRLAGLQQAKRLAFLADFVTAREAFELGLVTWVKPADELADFVAATASKMAGMPPIALSQTKELINGSASWTLADAVDEEARAQAVNYATEDTARAAAAFRDKSKTEYTGRWGM